MASVAQTAVKVPISVDQGADFDLTLVLKDSAGGLVDVTGYSGKMQLRKYVDAEVALELNSTPGAGVNGTITFGGAAGTVALHVEDDVMAAIASGAYVYDLRLTTSGDLVRFWVHGPFSIRGSVTR